MRWLEQAELLVVGQFEFDIFLGLCLGESSKLTISPMLQMSQDKLSRSSG